MNRLTLAAALLAERLPESWDVPRPQIVCADCEQQVTARLWPVLTHQCTDDTTDDDTDGM